MVLLRLLSLSFLIETVKTTGGCAPIVTTDAEMGLQRRVGLCGSVAPLARA